MLLALPESDSVTFFKRHEHQKALDSGDQQAACWHLFWDAYNWLKLFCYVSAFKARQLTAAVVHAYNTDNFLAWTILGRSTLEYAAVSYYFFRKISLLQMKGPHFAGSHLKAFEELMLQFVHGTRFNWPDLLAGDRDRLSKDYPPSGSSKAVNVLTAIKHLSRRDERYHDVEIAYAMLSDFAHPNMASHATVITMPTGPTDGHESEVAANPGPLRGEFIMVITLPWVSTGVGTTVELLMQAFPLLEAWLDYVEQGATVTIDFGQ